jgi:DNA-binding HxlR family transcriptional regulator
MANNHKPEMCTGEFVLAIHDTLNVISGKWKLPIMAVLLEGKKRFTEMARTIPNITPRMLSKELKELEMNGIVKRTVLSTIPVSVEYELTPSGRSIREVLDVMVVWGQKHRKAVLGVQKRAVKLRA